MQKVQIVFTKIIAMLICIDDIGFNLAGSGDSGEECWYLTPLGWTVMF